MDKRQKRQKRRTLTLQKRNELSALVKNLLEVVIKSTSNPKEEWQQFVQAHEILKRIQVLEAPLRPNKQTTPADRLANIDAFYRWATENGIQYDGARIVEFSGYDLGLEATRDIAKGERLFTVPRKLIISEECIEDDFKFAHFGSMTNLKLAYALMLEVVKNDSFWKPYLDLLPEKYTTVLYFSVEEMEQLQGSNALSAALRQARVIFRQYAFIYNCTQQAPRTNKASALWQAFRDQFCFDLYRWSVSTVMTRENLIPRCKEIPQSNGNMTDQVAALIPFWDMANHRNGYVSSFYDHELHQLESDAQVDFKKGEQIFIYYGIRSNAELMIHNGFINADNETDYVNIRLGLNTSDPCYEQRIELLKLLQMPQIQKNCELKLLPAPDYISPELLAFVRVFNMNATQLEHWINSERAQDLCHRDCALETSLETKTWEYLQTRLMLLLRFFPTTLESDEQKFLDYRKDVLQLNYIDAMILEFRILEKRILQNALEYVKQKTKS